MVMRGFTIVLIYKQLKHLKGAGVVAQSVKLLAFQAWKSEFGPLKHV